MAHWKHEPEREDGDGHDESHQDVFNARQWLRGVAERSQSDSIRGMMADLHRLELAAQPFFLGLDYDFEDRDDVDEIGPF